MCANVGATSRQNQVNIDDTQREAVRKIVKPVNKELKELQRQLAKMGIRKGLIKQRKHYL